MHIKKADIVPILQILAHQKCDYILLRPETLVEQPSSYRDVDLCMPPEVAPEFIRNLSAYASARGARVETRKSEPFAIDVTITQDDAAPIKLDIHTRVTWRGFPVFNYADILATAVPRNGIKHVDKQRGDVVAFVKDLFGRGRLDRKDRWWPEFICQVRATPNIYNAILVKHVFMFLTDSVIDRIQRGDRLWIENRKLLLQAVFIATQLSRRPFTSIVGHLQWWIVKIRQRTQTQ